MNMQDRIENEANQFAMCLLIPDFWLKENIKKGIRLDAESDPRIKEWARQLKVSEQLLIFRIGQYIGGFGT
jgi:Zn-dependent peptidase ImmA (M78 family)